jgi:hypothetical protein
MIDIRNIEIVTPDIERHTLIENNNNLKNLCILFFSLLVIAGAAYTINHMNKEQNLEK